MNPETQDYFVEEVKQALFDDPRLGATREERQNRVFRGGLRIYTTLDPEAQALATSARNDVLAEIAPEGTPTGLGAARARRGDRAAAQRHRRGRVGRAGHRARCGPWSAAPGSRARSSTSPPRASAAPAGRRSRSSC